MQPHQCRATCLESKTCHVYNFNITNGTCTGPTLPHPQALSNHVMEFAVFTQRLYRVCYEWVPYCSDDFIGDCTMSTDDRDHITHRMQTVNVMFYFTSQFTNCYAPILKALLLIDSTKVTLHLWTSVDQGRLHHLLRSLHRP